MVTAALISCVAGGGSIRLASIHQLETREIIAGEEFKIFGDGFVPGEVEILLDGTWLSPGEQPREQTLSFTGNAITEREISTVLPLETFRKLGTPHALFEGSVHARFEASSQVRMGYIEAVRGRVVLDVLSNEPDGGRTMSVLGERTDRFLKLVGVAGESDPDGGFLVTSVDSDRDGSTSDLGPGDVVLVSRGMRVYSELDLLPARSDTSVEWVVARSEADGKSRLHEVTIEVPHAARTSGPDPVWLVSGAMAVALALLSGEMLTILLLPFTALRRAFAALGARLGRRVDSIVSLPDEPATTAVPRSRWVQNLLALPVVLAVASGCAAAVLTAGQSIHVAAVYVLLVALAWLTGFRASRASASTLPARARRILACLLAPAPVAFIFIWRGLFTPSSSLDALAAGQGLEPWTWHGLGDPFALVLLVASLMGSGLIERRDVPLGRHLAHQLYTLVTCAVVTHVMLGGYASLPLVSEPGSAQATGLGLLLWLAKVLALFLLTQAHMRDRPDMKQSDLWTFLGRPALCLGAMVGSVMLGPTMESALPSIPHLTATAGAALMLILASSGRRGRETAAIRIRPW